VVVEVDEDELDSVVEVVDEILVVEDVVAVVDVVGEFVVVVIVVVLVELGLIASAITPKSLPCEAPKESVAPLI